MTTRDQYATLARELTSVLTTTELSYETGIFFVQEAVNEIYRKHGNGWGFALTPLNTSVATTAFDSQFDGAVVYRVAAKILKTINDTTGRADFYLQEAALIVADMEKYYLSANVDPTDREGNTTMGFSEIIGRMSLSEIIATVRGLTGVFDPQVVSNGMLDEIVNTAATELYNLRDWHIDNSGAAAQFYDFWLYDPVDGLWSETTIVGPSHILSYRDSGYDDADAARKNLPREVRIVFGNNTSTRAIRTDSLWDVSGDTGEYFYAFSTGVSNDTVLHVAPKIPTDAKVLVIAYGPNYGRISESYDPGPPPATSFTFLNFPAQFQMLVPYRAAQFVLMQVAPEDPRIEYYGVMYETLLSSLINFAELDHDSRSFSIGERGKDTPRYVPWFKPA